MEVYVFIFTICILLLVCLLTLGIIIGEKVAKHEGNTKDYSECSTECKHDNNSILYNGGNNMRTNTMGDVHESVDCGQDMGLEDKAERAIIVLNTLRTGSTRTEQEAIDFATECIEVRIRLERFFKERGV